MTKLTEVFKRRLSEAKLPGHEDVVFVWEGVESIDSAVDFVTDDVDVARDEWIHKSVYQQEEGEYPAAVAQAGAEFDQLVKLSLDGEGQDRISPDGGYSYVTVMHLQRKRRGFERKTVSDFSPPEVYPREEGPDDQDG